VTTGVDRLQVRAAAVTTAQGRKGHRATITVRSRQTNHSEPRHTPFISPFGPTRPRNRFPVITKRNRSTLGNLFAPAKLGHSAVTGAGQPTATTRTLGAWGVAPQNTERPPRQGEERGGRRGSPQALTGGVSANRLLHGLLRRASGRGQNSGRRVTCGSPVIHVVTVCAWLLCVVRSVATGSLSGGLCVAAGCG
jgi:hypothetical protein